MEEALQDRRGPARRTRAGPVALRLRLGLLPGGQADRSQVGRLGRSTDPGRWRRAREEAAEGPDLEGPGGHRGDAGDRTASGLADSLSRRSGYLPAAIRAASLGP